jgi:hypothetical protein
MYSRVPDLRIQTESATLVLKGQSHKISTSVFLSNNTAGSTDLWAKVVSNVDSYSHRYSTTKIDSAPYAI